MLEGIGFFHFGTGHQDPIDSLRAAMEATTENLRNALIVLPEGFNIRKKYWEPGLCNFDPYIVGALQGMARDFGIVFLAALIIGEPDGPQDPKPPYSGVYFIQGQGSPAPLGYKMEPDGSGNYTHRDENCYRVLPYGNVCIVTLICVDSSSTNFGDSPSNERARKRYEHLDKCISGSRCNGTVVMCVPAHPVSLDTNDVTRRCSGLPYLVFSSSSGEEGKGSFIMVDAKRTSSVEGPSNVVNTYPLTRKSFLVER